MTQPPDLKESFMTDKNYQKLSKVFNQYYLLGKINSSLSWDTQVVMPKSGFAIREKQLTFLSEIGDKLLTSDAKKSLEDCDPEKLDEFEKRNLELMTKMINHKNAIPDSLRTEFNKLSLRGEFLWLEARKKNNYKEFEIALDKLIKTTRKIALIKSDIFKITPYETLLDEHDPDRKENDLDKIFKKLGAALPKIIDQVIAKQNSEKRIALPKNDWDVELQKKLVRSISNKIGLTNDWSRIDESAHPFCTGYVGDVRITTRYDSKDLISSIMGIVHESGHATYDNNLPKSYINQPIGQDAGMALHESQSLLFEMQIARSRSFAQYLSEQIAQIFELDLNKYNQDFWYKELNHVKKSYIRVDADELTYPLHIAMRYEIEKKLINGDLEVVDIKDIWNLRMKELFSLKAPDLANGCYQDIHWSSGSLGYFPTYTLGAIYAAQIVKQMKSDIKNYDDLIETANFKPISSYLKTNIHQYGSRFKADEIIKNLSSKALDVEGFLDYLLGKYLG